MGFADASRYILIPRVGEPIVAAKGCDVAMLDQLKLQIEHRVSRIQQSQVY